MTFSVHTLWLTAIINASVLILLFPPIICYGLYKFYKRRDEMFIMKRYPKLVYIINILCIVAIIEFSALNSVKQLSPLQSTNPMAFNIVGRTLNTINILVYTIQCTLLCRFWLMFYDLNYSNSNMNKQWKSYLDPTLIDKDFWLKNKEKWGSLSYLLKIIFIAIIIFACPPIIYGQIYFHSPTAVTNYFTVPLHLIMLVIFIILSWKSPQILDLFYMRFELKCLASIIMLTAILIFTANPLYNSQDDMLALIGRIYRMDIGIVCYGLLPIISTLFILKKLDATYNKGYTQQSQRQKSLELQRVLLDQRNFELFVQHLAREFSVEMILSFIEMVQFKHLINSKFNLNAFGDIVGTISQSHDISINDDEEIEEKEMQNEIFFDFIQCDITKNASIPKSLIVYKSDHTQRDTNDITPFLKITHKLYNKYIKVGGELEINISGESRDIFINDMEYPIQIFIDKQLNNDHPMEAVDLFEYFDCIIEEMYCLLTSSCNRFLETDKNVNIARIHLTKYDTIQIQNTLQGTK